MQWRWCAFVVCVLAGCATPSGNREKAQNMLETGYLLRDKGDFGGAARAFAAAVNADPSFGFAHMELGAEYLRYNLRLEDAVKEFTRAAEADPKLWRATQFRVAALLGLGDREGALALQRKLVEEVPDKAVVHQNLGDLLLKESKWQEAEKCFRKAIELKSPYPLAMAGLGLALGRGGKVKEGIGPLQAAVEAMPDDAGLRLELARLLLRERRFADAEAQAETARSMEPRDGVAYHILAEIRAAQGDKNGAVAFAREALARRCTLSADLVAKLGEATAPGAER